MKNKSLKKKQKQIRRTVNQNGNCHEKKVSAFVSPNEIRDEKFTEKLQNLVAQLRPYLSVEQAETADRCLDLFNRNEFVILVAGEFSVGKSSFLNALIGQPILLTDASETTAAITYLRTGEGVEGVKKDHVKITYKDGSTEWISIHDSKRLKQATTSLGGNTKAISRVKSAEVYCSRSTLDIPPGFTLIDTPGLNGSASHAELTHREMGLCHAAIYLLDATKFGTLSNKEEFARLYRYAPEVLFVVNKWDLVRGASKNLTQMKRDAYLPVLGKWASDGTVSDENIFVLSGVEALQAKERYLAKVNGLPPDKAKEVSIIRCLPKPDNEYFPLESRLGELMRTGEKAKMIRRRPLQTLLQLVQDSIEAMTLKQRDFLTASQEETVRVQQEEARIQRCLADAELTFGEIRDFAQRLTVDEIKAYRTTIRQADMRIGRIVAERIESMDVSALESESGQQRLTAFVEKHIEDFYRRPIMERFNAFADYIRNKLETSTKITAGETVSISIAQTLSSDFSQMENEKSRLKKKMSAVGSRREEAQAEIRRVEEELGELADELEKFVRQEKEYARLDATYRQCVEQRNGLGSRPAPTSKTIMKPTPVKKPGGLCRKLLSFFTFGLVDDEVEEIVDVPVTIKDDSRGKAWDTRHADLQEKVNAAKSLRDAAAPNRSRQRVCESRKVELQRVLQSARKEIARLNDEECRQREALKRLGNTAVKTLVAKSWQGELARIRQNFELSVDGFRQQIDRLLKNYWQSRRLRAEKYIESFSEQIRAMEERRKRTSDENRKIKEALKTLSDIQQVLTHELALV